MKTRLLLKTGLLCGGLLACLILATALKASDRFSARAPKEDLSRLALKLFVGKPDHILGELVELKLMVLNKSNAAAALVKGADVWEGHLKVFIAYQNGEYKEYLGPGWGLRDVLEPQEREIPPGRSFTTEATVLYNHRVETGHLNPAAARRAAQGRLETEYALSQPGVYRIKAVLYDSSFENRIESEPVQINVSAPQGSDLQVWNTIKEDAEYGYFIQTGGPKGHPEAPKSKHLYETLEQLAASHPNSKYAPHINNSLSKYRSTLAESRRRKPAGN